MVLVITCAVILGWAGLRANAAWHFLVAQTITDDMYEAGAFPPEGLDTAEKHLQRALARFPGNPDYLGLSGTLKELRASRPGVVGREYRALLESAARDYREALTVRPLWPYNWVNLLSVKDKLDQRDVEFNRAMQKSAETGPWEPSVQLQLIRSGVRHWDALQSPERTLVRDTVADALRVQPHEVFELARFYVRPDLVCGPKTRQPRIERWCEQFQGG